MTQTGLTLKSGFATLKRWWWQGRGVVAERSNGALLCRYAVISAMACSAGLRCQQVHNPNASFIDVQARRVELRSSQDPRLLEAIAHIKSCKDMSGVAPPVPGQDIPSRYEAGHHGELNPEEHILSKPYYDIEERVSAGANGYLVTGDPAEATCVINALLPWARSRALLWYNAKDDMVVWFQSTWAVASLSLAVSVVRSEPSLSKEDLALVIGWLHKAAWKAVTEHRGPTSATEYSNHLFWRGLAATSAGVISGDNGLFDQGLATYRRALSEMNQDGSFPAEMARYELALHYQAFAIEPLVLIAQLAARQGVDLYDVREHGHQLNDAVLFLRNAISNPQVVRKYTDTPQQMHPDLEPGRSLMAWLEFWTSTHGTEMWSDYLATPYYDSRIGGSSTLYARTAQRIPH